MIPIDGFQCSPRLSMTRNLPRDRTLACLSQCWWLDSSTIYKWLVLRMSPELSDLFFNEGVSSIVNDSLKFLLVFPFVCFLSY